MLGFDPVASTPEEFVARAQIGFRDLGQGHQRV
jgi:hypothetical protein